MVRIVGVDLLKKKRVEYVFIYIYGIGFKSFREILEVVGIFFDKCVYELSEDEVFSIVKKI